MPEKVRTSDHRVCPVTPRPFASLLTSAPPSSPYVPKPWIATPTAQAASYPPMPLPGTRTTSPTTVTASSRAWTGRMLVSVTEPWT